MRHNPRAATRNRLWLAGVLPALVLLAFCVKVGVMLDHDGDGRAAFEAGDATTARAEFADNRTLNLMERWVAPYDEGTALYVIGKHPEAVERLEEALEVVPADHECTVRINLALAHEAIGDAAAEQGEDSAARDAWERGLTVLTEGGCSDSAPEGEEVSAASGDVETRIRAKLEQQPEQEPEPKRGKQEQKRQQPDRGPSRKEREVEQKNQRGAEERRDWEEFNEDFGTGNGYEW